MVKQQQQQRHQQQHQQQQQQQANEKVGLQKVEIFRTKTQSGQNLDKQTNSQTDTVIPVYYPQHYQCIGPVIWNFIPLSVGNLSSLSSFKSELKTSLFPSAY